MKKILYAVFALLSSATSFGQIEQNVNTTTGTRSNPITDIDSIRFYSGQMQIILQNGSAILHPIGNINNVSFSGELQGTIATLGCNAHTLNGRLVEGVLADGASVSLPYTDGNGGVYDGLTIPSSGVIGLTITLIPGILTEGAGLLNFAITGTPDTTGLASFPITLGGLSCTLYLPVEGGVVTALNCDAATPTGNLIAGLLSNEVRLVIPYTGGNSGPYDGQMVPSTGVTGLTATLMAGNFANGAGALTFDISGTPSAAGVASFSFTVGGISCTFEWPVEAGGVATLDCADATINGILVTDVLVNNTVSAAVAYTGGNGGLHEGQVVTSTGVTGLTATLVAGSFAQGNGTLTYTIMGTPNAVGIAYFLLEIGDQTCTLEIPVAAGAITALNCGSTTLNGQVIVSVSANGVTAHVPYTGGNGGPFTGQVVTSTNLTGLTATLTSGFFAVGSGQLNYAITGSSATEGDATFGISVAGQSCSFTVAVMGGTISTLTCNSANITGNLIAGVNANVTAQVPYTGGNGGTYTGQAVSSTGVTGLTATLAAGTFTASTGNLFYTITGRPNSAGAANFALNIGGATCTLTIAVAAGAINSITCTSPTRVGTLVSGVVASGVSFQIPYTGGNGGLHSGQSVTSTSVTGLTARLTAGSFVAGSGQLTYTITGTPSAVGTASFAVNIGGQTCTVTMPTVTGAVTSISCPTTTYAGTLVSGVAASGVTARVSYSGGNAGPHNGQTITSTGVTGLTATLSSGRFASGASTLTYTITGTPNTNGTASFAINIGGRTCTMQLPVVTGAITALSCSSANITGTYISGVALGTARAVINYSGGNAGPYAAQTAISTGVTGLTARVVAGRFAAGSGQLTYTITGTPTGVGTASFAIEIGGQNCTLQVAVVGGSIAALTCGSAVQSALIAVGQSNNGTTLQVPYTGGNGGPHNGQTVNSTGVSGLTATLAAGTFASGASQLIYTITGSANSIGTANFALNIGGKTCTVSLTTGVVCDVVTQVVSVTNPTTGKTWMDRNLGASRAATSSTDAQAYGDLYQWGRRSDGHQCRNSATTTTLSSTNTPANGNFILAPDTPYDWRSPQNNNLWQGVNGANNPCPTGYRVPTLAELTAEMNSWGASSQNASGAYASRLKLPMTGYRSRSNGELNNVGTSGFYWSSTVNGVYAGSLNFYSTSASANYGNRAYGFSLRCIKD